VHGVVDLLAVELADDVERRIGHGGSLLQTGPVGPLGHCPPHPPDRPGRAVTLFMPSDPLLGSLRRRRLGMLFRVNFQRTPDLIEWLTEVIAADYPSGQRELTVNQLALPTGVRIPHLPPRRIHVIRSTGARPRVAPGQRDG